MLVCQCSDGNGFKLLFGYEVRVFEYLSLEVLGIGLFGCTYLFRPGVGDKNIWRFGLVFGITLIHQDSFEDSSLLTSSFFTLIHASLLNHVMEQNTALHFFK